MVARVRVVSECVEEGVHSLSPIYSNLHKVRRGTGFESSQKGDVSGEGLGPEGHTSERV